MATVASTLLACASCFGYPLAAHAQAAPTDDPALDAIAQLLATPEQSIDLATAKLTIDQLIDPTIDANKALKQLDDLASRIAQRVPGGAPPSARFEVLRSFLYEPGDWNQYQPFRYDLDDPMGTKVRNKLIPNYLITRRGNCVSMPLLVVILGQKLGLDVTIATAPAHMFVKFRDESGDFRNFEATNGTFASDFWIRHESPMTDQAIASGIYMRPLSKRETVAEMLGPLLQYWNQQGWEDRRIAAAKIVLRHFPNNLAAILTMASAYARVRYDEFALRYAQASDVPPPLRPRLHELDEGVRTWGGRAESLGWREPSDAAEAEYKDRIRRAKASLRETVH